MNKLTLAIATGLGTGYFPIAPGTAGTLVGIPIIWLLRDSHPLFYIFVTIALLIIGVRCVPYAEEHFGKKDAGHIVIDEIVGYTITMYLIPVSWATIIVGFFAFRFFDIVKCWPARTFDRMENTRGWGVMLDDVAAGIYACVLMHILTGWII